MWTGIREKENESWISHWERSKHLLNVYPVSLSVLGPFNFIHCILFFWTLGTEQLITLIGYLLSFPPFLKINKMTITIPISQMRRLTCPLFPSQSWWSWDLNPGLTLLYTPMRQAVKRHPVFHPFIPAGSGTSYAQKVFSKQIWTKTMVTRIMVKLGASVDKGVEKEDLWGQKGDPKETSNKTQGEGLFAFSRSPLIHQSWRG